MSERDAKAFMQDMREAGRRILTYTESLDYAAFREDFKTQDAVLRNLEVLGEAAKHMPKNSLSSTPVYPGEKWPERVTA
jgi:uncharacterized protein with HEPN domain